MKVKCKKCDKKAYRKYLCRIHYYQQRPRADGCPHIDRPKKSKDKNLKAKIKGMESYEFEKREFPHPRSPKALKNIAQYRGVSVGSEYSEAFCIIRCIN